ncbi:hypothetical protein RFI_12057 [Reticulomyxa filosa]|uniref:alkaline phosphatase n=1 Tax=Reticulomyxa filosa TaxID=46433 RepID=X6NIA8_RETFI|nr:hypothetical protein RFI_12057 [Reticulomyxa filosa]|eukprot:ETO25087.1 hypothetical protein RFI_12057 [Reticulomyxa filosa]
MYVYIRITHATPGSFYAHVLIREWENLIGHQLGMKNKDETMVDVAFGGGLQHFIPQTESGSKRHDNWDFKSDYKEYGWNSLSLNRTALMDLGSDDLPAIGLFSMSHLPYYLDRLTNANDEYSEVPSLVEMSDRAIHLLDSKYDHPEQGWFLMIEASRIDMCEHSNDPVCLVNEMAEMNDVLQSVFEYAENDGNTLVVALADHETGGVAMGRGISVQADQLVDYQAGMSPRQFSTVAHQGSFDYDVLIPPLPNLVDSIGYSYMYNWYPDALKNATHTSEYIVSSLLATKQSVPINTLVDTVESGFGISCSANETSFLESMLHRDPLFGNFTTNNPYFNYWSPVMVHGISLIMSSRSLTGWTTHGHTGLSIYLSYFATLFILFCLLSCGVGAELFAGQHTNEGIGRLLSTLLQVSDLQATETQHLQDIYVKKNFTICDNTDPLPYYLYNKNVTYPEGNLLTGYCVTAYQ